MQEPWLIFRRSLLLILTLAGLLLAQEDYSSWPHSQKLIVNTTGSGAGVSDNVTGFPLLVRISSANFPGLSSIQSGAADIRFAKASGEHVSYEIEHWVDGTGGEIWVKMDTVYGNDNTHYLTMYWGKSGAASQSNPGAVFDTANGFQGVWHFSEAAGEIAKDATANKYDGTPTGTAKPTDATGPIGKAKSYDGKTSGYEMMNTASSKMNFQETGTYTVSGWVNMNIAPKANIYYNICNKSDVQYNLACDEIGKWEMTQFNKAKRYDMTGRNAAAKAVSNAWVYVVGIHNVAKQAIYIDGICTDSGIVSKTESFAASQTYNVGVGRESNGGTDPFSGMIDEVRVESVARDKNWIKLSAMTQKAGSTVVSFEGTSAIRAKSIEINAPNKSKDNPGRILNFLGRRINASKSTVPVPRVQE